MEHFAYKALSGVAKGMPKWIRMTFGGLNAVASLFPAVWAVLLSLLLAVLIHLWAEAQKFAAAPEMQFAAKAFLIFLWTIIGLIYLIDRNKPKEVTIFHDLKYGITFEDFLMRFSPLQPNAILQFGVMVRNYSAGPIRHEVETFEIIVSNRTLPRLAKGEIVALMPRGSGKTAWNRPFKRDDIKEFFGSSVTGTAEISINYGHADKQLTRQLCLSCEIFLDFQNDSICLFSYVIKRETDRHLTAPQVN